MVKCKLVGSLDVLGDLLADPDWLQKAQKVKTLRQLRQILVDYCKEKGGVIQIGRDLAYLYSRPLRETEQDCK